MNRAVVLLAAWGSSAAWVLLFVATGRATETLLLGDPLSPSTGFRLTALVLLAAVLAGVGPLLGARAQAHHEQTLRRDVVSQVLRLGAERRGRERTGRIVSTATDGVERAAAYRGTFLVPMIASATVPVVVLVLAGVLLDPVTALWLALSVPAVPLAVGGFQMAFRSVSQRYRANARVLSAQFLDAFQGLTTLRLLGAGESAGRRLAHASEELRRHVMRLLAGNQLVLLVVDSLFSLAMVTAAAGLALHRLSVGAVTPGEALALVLVSTLLLEPLDRIGQFFYIGMGGIAAAREIRAFLAEQPAVVDAPGVVAPPDLTAATLRFEGVAHAYEEGVPVLRSVDLAVADGETVALVGPSGAGKSTLGSILLGDERPTAGRVLLGGHDLAEVPLAWVRRQVGVVAQQTFLFTGTLRENLLVADPGADDARCWQALEDADLAVAVRSMPAGLDTQVGERGLALSGGQAQRLAVARAFLEDAPVLLLDEPTAHVDLAAERAILASLDRLGRGRTVVVVSHRPATIEGADRVLTLAGGIVR